MAERVVLFSHPLRGAKGSPERIADIRAARQAMTRLRTHPNYEGATITAPYLLYGETSPDPAAARAKGEVAYHLVPHTEVVVGGDAVCGGVYAEVVRALARGLPVKACHCGSAVGWWLVMVDIKYKVRRVFSPTRLAS